MEITLRLRVPEESADPEHSTGLTEDAFDQLSDVLMELGYEFVSGPDADHRTR